jgi:hypothetical protein
LLIVIVLKTLVDVGLGSNLPIVRGSTFSSGNTSIET